MHWQAAIFDMDGLLVDSEPLWRRAEQKVFGELGIQLNDELCRQTTGLGTEDTVRYWLQRTLWSTQEDRQIEVDEIAHQLRQQALGLIQSEARAMPGVYPLLERCRELGMTMVIASGSSMELIRAVIERLELHNYISSYFSAANEKAGKPAPDVYLRALSALRLPTEKCIAFEDSVRGVEAARAANLYTVAVPEQGIGFQQDFSAASLVVKDLRTLLSMAPFLNDTQPTLLA
ncbi:Sugar-phosphatase [Saliniradius amylolyticus]|uniref:Sugar-phosphatase n=1 Tax=Saliniradius amylolyticus TaxID=2183582 RepID=A0A2S2E6F0_9ALTE|nr:HAD-IA family hydrolase [Saliniradius amylolyticus]AWL13213.1 Sugar-phosphatase [Saliniradius amylolyticus]